MEIKSENAKWILIRAVGIFLLIAATFPISITVTSWSLDPSWSYLLNIAAERGLKFGSDLAFTWGPLGFLATTLNIGHNAQIAMLFYGCLIILEIWLLWCAFRRLQGKYGVVRLVVFLLFILVGSNWLGKEYYICFLFFLSVSLAWTERTPHRYLIVSSLLAVIAALVKFNAGIQCAATLVLFVLGKFLTERRAAKQYILYLPTTAVAYMAAYLIYNPSLSAFFHYISTSLDITSGYSVAMSVIPDSRVLAFAVVCGVVYCLITLIIILADTQSGIYMLLYSGVLFQMFKHGFVRADSHTYGFFAGFLMVCAVEILFIDCGKLREALHRQKNILSYVSGLLAAMMILLPFYELNPSVQSVVNLYPAKYREVLHELKARLTTPISDIVQDVLPDNVLEIIGQDSVAILPWELLIGAYNDINMTVMPAMQSYEAYTAALDAESAAFFAGESAPKYIIFSFDTIDGRIALLETPAIWQTIYENYEAVLLSEPYLILKKSDTPYQMDLSEPDVRTVSKTEQIELSEGQCYVKLDADLTLWGKLNKLFYHIPPVTITLTYLDGTQRSGRVLPDVLKNGVILSNLPDSLSDMCLCINGIDRENRIVSFQINGEGWKFYKNQMTVSIQEVQLQKKESLYNPLQALEIEETTDPTVGIQLTEEAQPYCIDFVNEMPRKDTVQISKRGLHLVGWALDDTLKCSPEAIYLKLGEKYYKMHRVERIDVFEYFGGYNGEPLCGFDSWVRLSDVSPGDYPASLIIICSGGTSYYVTPELFTVHVTD